MKDTIKELLNNKPSKDKIFNSITLNDDCFEKSCKQQCKLINQQKLEQDKLKPTIEQLQESFTI